jgi:hypothetical protein
MRWWWRSYNFLSPFKWAKRFLAQLMELIFGIEGVQKFQKVGVLGAILKK